MIKGHTTTSSRLLGGLVLTYGVLIVYASLMPYDLYSGPHIQHGLERIFSGWPINPTGRVSGSDVLSNLLLYIPLGWMIAVRNQLNGLLALAAFLNGIIICTLLSAVIETIQLASIFRTASASDWLLNTVGGGFGTMVGIVNGVWIWEHTTEWLKNSWREKPLNIVTLALMALLAADATAPYLPSILLKDVYRNIKQSELSIFHGLSLHPWHWWVFSRGLMYAVLTMLLAYWRRHDINNVRTWVLAAVAATWFSIILEILKLMVVSRSMNVANIAVSGIGAIFAFVVGVRLTDQFNYRRKVEFAILAVLVYLFYLGWFPFNFDLSPEMFNRFHFSLIRLLPLYDYAMGATMNHARLFVQSILLLGLLSYLLKIRFGWFSKHTGGIALAAVFSAGLGVLIEGGQIFLPSRTPATTDIYCFAVGGALGAWVTRKGLSAED